MAPKKTSGKAAAAVAGMLALAAGAAGADTRFCGDGAKGAASVQFPPPSPNPPPPTPLTRASLPFPRESNREFEGRAPQQGGTRFLRLRGVWRDAFALPLATPPRPPSFAPRPPSLAPRPSPPAHRPL